MQMDHSIFSGFHSFRGYQLFVGFSGGADSTALLMIAAKGAKSNDFDLTAVHFNHHLRGAESDSEAVEAEKFARKLGVKFMKIDLQISAGGNLESRARQARLEKWKELCAVCENPLVLLGHHKDDLIENFFIRIGRGSNVSGLTGMQIYSEVEGVRFFRPLLICSRSEIEAFLRENGVGSWAQDSSNLTCDFSRNVLRNRILPELYKLFPGGRKAVENTLENLACDAAFLDSTARLRYVTADDHCKVEFWQAQERAMTVRMLRMLCREFFVDDSPLTSAAVERFEAMTGAGHDGICVLDEKRKLRISGGRIYPLSDAPQTVQWCWKNVPEIYWGNWHFSVEKAAHMPEKCSLDKAFFDAGSLPDVLEIGAPLTGEKMRPFGKTEMVKVKDLRIKRKIPAFPVNPVLRIPGNRVLWLPGIRHSGEFTAVKERETVIFLAEKRKDF